jgi:hypothetical protein
MNKPTHINRREHGSTSNPTMDQRVKIVETDLAVVKTDLAVIKIDLALLKTDVAVIKSNYATKGDLGELRASMMEMKSSIILWVATSVFLAQLIPAFAKHWLP